MEIPTGKHLKRCRKSLGLTQLELSQLCGVAQSVIAKVENESVDARASTLKKIVSALNRKAFPGKPHTVDDIMVEDLITLSAEDTIQSAIDKMISANVSQLPVISSSGSPVGLVSEASLLTHGAQTTGSVRSVMRANAVVVNHDLSISEARELLTTEEALLITKNGRLIGLVSRIDMVRALRDISPQE
jgi:predicted transcriptional regulator